MRVEDILWHLGCTLFQTVYPGDPTKKSSHRAACYLIQILDVFVIKSVGNCYAFRVQIKLRCAMLALGFYDRDSDTGMANYTLELLHFTDQEAGANSVFDAPNLSAVLDALRAQDLGDDGLADNTLTLSAGDAIIPGLFYDASEAVFGTAGIADIQIQNELGVQAVSFGNHEFDFGTGTIAALIDGSATGNFADLSGTMLDGQDFGGTMFPYLSANLDFSTDANMAPLEIAGGLAPQGNVVSSSTVINVNGEMIGVVGAVTPTLNIISSPGDLGISPNNFSANPTSEDMDALAAEIQTEVDALLAANPGMNKIVLLAHMQRIEIEQGLAARLENVDIVVAGGSNTRLLDDNDRARAGDSDQGQYPIFVENAGGTQTAIVNTDGSYKYVGRLVIDFDADGNIIAESYDATVSGAYATDAQGVSDLNATDLVDPEVQAIANAIQAQIIETESNVFGVSDVFLNGNRSGTGAFDDADGVRTQETNLGNLTADANLAIAQESDNTVVVSIKNGGGIRASIGETIVPAGGSEPVRSPNEEIRDGDGNVVKPVGGISQNDIQTTLAFNNGLTLLTLTREELVDVLEHGIGALPGVSGRFPQVSGVEFSFDASQPEGSRIMNADIVGNDGRLIAKLVQDGELVGDPSQEFRVVTLSFLASGGDGYPFDMLSNPNRVDLFDLDANGEDDDAINGDATFAVDGTEQDALAEYLDDNFNPVKGGFAFNQEDTGPNTDQRIVDLGNLGYGSPAPSEEIELTRLASFATGDGEGASEVVVFDPQDARMYVTNGASGNIDVISIADPKDPTLVESIDVAQFVSNYAGIQSVAVSDTHVAVAAAREDAEGNHMEGVVLVWDRDSETPEVVPVGFLPDMVTFTPDGTRILVANEGEPNNDGNGAENPGSVSLIDVATGAETRVGFDAFDSQVTSLREDGVRIFPDGDGFAAPSVDFEPEYITVSRDGTTAYVTLQEANAVAVLDLATSAFTEILPLGTVDHSLPGNEIDASDRDDMINIVNQPLFGMRMPDAIASYEVGGQTYFVTANEGDARDSADYLGDTNEQRGDDVTLDPTAFPNAEELQQDENLGRINVSSFDGDTDGDGDQDRLVSYGSRSFTIFDSMGNVVFDSGSDFERIIADTMPPNFFNNQDFPSDDLDVVDEDRSDNKGPEPEAVAIGQIGEEIYAFIGLERTSGILVYNVTDPANAHFVTSMATQPDGDVSIETLSFVSAEDSPTGVHLLLAAAEVSGTTAIYQLDQLSNRIPEADENIVLDGGVDTVDLTEGNAVQLTGAAGAFAGDTITGFGEDDSFVFEGASLRSADISFNADTGVLTVGGEALTLTGAPLSGGAFMAATVMDGGVTQTVLRYVEEQAATSESSAVDLSAINGIANGDFLTGSNSDAFDVTLGNAGAAFSNSLGYFTRDAETGTIEEVGILFADARAAGSGATADIDGIDADDELGFFLVQNAASRVSKLQDDGSVIGLDVQDGQLYLTDDGAVLADTIIFNSLDASLNADGLEHVLSGATTDGAGLNVGFEDLLGYGDRDFQDVTFTVTVDDTPLV